MSTPWANKFAHATPERETGSLERALERLGKGDVGVAGSGRSVEGLDDVLPAGGPARHDHDRMIRLEESADGVLVDAALPEELEERLEGGGLRIRSHDLETIRAGARTAGPARRVLIRSVIPGVIPGVIPAAALPGQLLC